MKIPNYYKILRSFHGQLQISRKWESVLNDVSGNNVNGDISEATLASPGKWREVQTIKELSKGAILTYEADINRGTCLSFFFVIVVVFFEGGGGGGEESKTMLAN